MSLSFSSLNVFLRTVGKRPVMWIEELQGDGVGRTELAGMEPPLEMNFSAVNVLVMILFYE